MAGCGLLRLGGGQVEQGAIIGTGQGRIQQGKQLVLRPFPALYFGEDGSTDKNLAPGVL